MIFKIILKNWIDIIVNDTIWHIPFVNNCIHKIISEKQWHSKTSQYLRYSSCNSKVGSKCPWLSFPRWLVIIFIILLSLCHHHFNPRLPLYPFINMHTASQASLPTERLYSKYVCMHNEYYCFSDQFFLFFSFVTEVLSI